MRPGHLVHTWSGIFGSVSAPQEEWQFSLRSAYVGSGEPDLAAAATRATALKDAYATAMVARFPSTVRLTKVTTAQVGDDGKWAKNSDGAYVKGEWTGDVAGTGSGTAMLPLQTALCVTLTTPRAGATGKGRIFLPLQGVTLESNGRLSSASVTSYLTNVRAFLLAVNTAAGATQVFSSKGYASPVTGIKIGVVPDTQRSRRGDLLESYQALAL